MSIFKYGVVHKWRHANLDIFDPIVTLFITVSTVVTKSLTSSPKTVTSFMDDS